MRVLIQLMFLEVMKEIVYNLIPDTYHLNYCREVLNLVVGD